MLKSKEEKQEFQRRNNTGSVFINKYKNRDNQPDFQGECLVDGQKYRIAGWANTTRSGDDMMNLVFTPWEEYEALKELRQQQKQEAEALAANTRHAPVELPEDDEFTDDIPF